MIVFFNFGSVIYFLCIFIGENKLTPNILASMTREFFNDYMFVMIIILCIVEQVAKQFPVS